MNLKEVFKLDTSPKKVQLALLFIISGILLRIIMAKYANIEPVLAISMMAGLVLGGLWAFIVPLAIMALSDWAINAMFYGTSFTWQQLVGISLFTWTGMIFVGYMGTRMKPSFLFRMKGVAVFTGVAIVLTILYDLWTLIGYKMIAPDMNIEVVLMAQIPFTIMHILSTLIFVPLFGTMYIYTHEYGLPWLLSDDTELETPDEDKQGDAA